MTEHDAFNKPGDKQSTQMSDGNNLNTLAVKDGSFNNKDQQRQMTEKCVKNGLLPGCELGADAPNSKVKHDAHGNVTEITRPDGDTTRFKYDANGKLKEVTMPHGTVLTTTDGVHWKNSETGKTTDLKVEVRKDGTYSLEQNGKKAVLLPDGSSVRSEIPANGFERVTSVTHNDGRTSEFKYGADGKLNEVKMPGGTVLTTADGGKTWLDHSTGKTSTMKIDVAKDGTYYLERDGKMAMIHPSGDSEPIKRTLEDPGKVKERHPANYKPGHPYDEVVYEDGTTRQLRPGGTTVDVRKNMTVTERHDHSVSVIMNGETKTAKPTHPERGVKGTSVDDKGNVTYKYEDGSSTTQRRDGKVEETTKNADKSLVTAADGHVTATKHAGANREFKYDDKGNLTELTGNTGRWKRMTGADGQEYWQNQDKPQMQWHGKMQVDKEGNLHYTPNDPHAPGWTFTRDGRDVPASRGYAPTAHADSSTRKEAHDGGNQPQQAPKDAPKDPHKDAHKDAHKNQSERRQPIVVDTSVPIPRELFDKEGTPSTVKIPPEKGHTKK